MKIKKVIRRKKSRKKTLEDTFANIKLKTKPRLDVGDRVRIVKEKSIFDKGYKSAWSTEIYRVCRLGKV